MRIGVGVDAVNGIIYVFRGEYSDAAICALGLVPIAGDAVQGVKAGKTVVYIAKVEGKVPNKVTDLAKDMKGWLGKDATVITNKNGDKVFMSGDGTKRIRFDINNTSPHNNPHGHVEELVNGKWVKSGPIYPIDVPHN